MGTVTLPNGTVLTEVTRRSCLDRIAAVPLRSIEYSNTVISAITDRRSDCSGYASHALATPKKGPGIWLHAYSTSSFVSQHVLEVLKWSELLPGDMICSPPDQLSSTGHIAIWLGGDRFPTGEFHVRDHGGGMGPKDRWVKWYGQPGTWLDPARIKAYRYVAVTEDETSGDDMLLVRVKATGAIYATTGTHYHHLTPATYPVALAAWHKTTWDYEVPTEPDMAAFGIPTATPPQAPPSH